MISSGQISQRAFVSENLRQDSFIWFHRSTTPQLLLHSLHNKDNGISETKDTVITPVAEINFGANGNN